MQTEKVLLNAVLVFPVRGETVLLARKMKKIGAGCWNGYGGGIEEGESAETACVRELHEESGLITSEKDIELVATVDFHNTKSDSSTFTCRVFVYTTRNWTGDVRETAEMSSPTWFPITELPLPEMMPADRKWLPHALAGKRLTVEAWYGPFQKELLRSTEMRVADELSA